MTRSEKMAVWTEWFMRKIDQFGDVTEAEFLEAADLWWDIFPEYIRWL
jgi:hypothetical protein